MTPPRTVGGPHLRAAALLLLFLCLASFLWALSLDALRTATLQGEAVVLRCDTTPVLSTGYSDMVHTESRVTIPRAFSLWTELSHRGVESPVTGRMADVSVLLVRGDSRLVLPVSPVLADGDETGCLLDAKTAVELFGSTAVRGELLRFEGREYVIRDVFPAPAATVLLHPDPWDAVELPNVTLGDYREADAFLMRHGLTAGIQVRHRTFRLLAGLLAFLPALAAFGVVLGVVVNLHRQNRSYPLRRAVTTLLLLALATWGILQLLEALPPEWVPSRWSDFSFWSGSFRELRRWTRDYLSAPWYRPDLLLMRPLRQALAALPAAAALLPCRRLLLRLL